MKETITAYAFTDGVSEKNIDRKIERKPKEFVTKLLTGSKYNFGVQNVMSDGIYKLQGYKYNFRPFLKKYLYKQKNADWQETYALNKANVRHLVYGRIIKIIEVN